MRHESKNSVGEIPLQMLEPMDSLQHEPIKERNEEEGAMRRLFAESYDLSNDAIKERGKDALFELKMLIRQEKKERYLPSKLEVLTEHFNKFTKFLMLKQLIA